MAAWEALTIPVSVWNRDDMRNACRRRDVAGILQAVQRSTGASQTQLAMTTGILQGRISEILRGTRIVTAFEVFERIADGLAMPDETRVLLGLAPVHPSGLNHLGPLGGAELLAAYPSQAEAAPDIREAASTATTIDVLAVRGLGIIGMNDSVLRATVARTRPVLRALLLNPDSPAAHRRAHEVGESPESFTSGVQLSVARLRELGEHTEAQVQVYFYDMLPTWRVLALDEVQFVSAFGQSHEGHTSPMYKIAASAHGALHRGFHRFTAELRGQAHRVI